MRFTFTEEQQLFQQSVRDLLAKAVPTEELRAAWADPTGRSRERWAQLASLGVTGMLVPTRHGGLGMDEVELVLPLDETGRAALPEPIIETALVASRLLAEVAPPPVQAQWLPAIAAGEAWIAVGLAAGGPYVADAHVADLLLLQDGDSLYAVSPRDVELIAQQSIDGARRIFTLEWMPSAATEIAAGEAARAAMAAAFDRAAFGVAAQLLGVADRMIEMAADYARQREQFGQPIGSFQAVKHLLADALLKLDFARPMVYRAAWSVAHPAHAATRARDTSMAKAYASEAATLASRVALQVHGAIGYTWECHAHLFYKRGRHCNVWMGAPDEHYERVLVL
ncbi:MAG TPA: acyl-CoA dehydrogenase family protein, partial [Acidimicrobiales bacterium]|nr:acyl-CoA dehydrogenase family protein [Acidimicrobiales bacterium]